MAKFVKFTPSEFFAERYQTMVVYSVMNEEKKEFEGIYFRYFDDDVENAIIVRFNSVNNEIMLKIPERLEIAYSSIIDFVYEAERQIRSGQLQQAIEYYNFEEFRGDTIVNLPVDQNISTIVTEKVMKENDFNVRELEIEKLQKEIKRLRDEKAFPKHTWGSYNYWSVAPKGYTTSGTTTNTILEVSID